MRRAFEMDNGVGGRNVSLGKVRAQADMMRSEVLVEVMRGAGKLAGRLSRRRSGDRQV